MEILDQPFDLTARQTVELKKRISDDAIKVMIDSTAAFTPSAPAGGVIGIEAPKASGATPTAGTSEAAIAANINNPNAPHDSGIHIYTSERNNQKVMTALERAAYQGTKGNFLGHAMAGGLLKPKSRAVIPGPRASIRVSDSRPEFYFYSEDKSAALGKSGFGAQAVSNPNQLALVKLETKKNNCETVVGSIDFGTMDFGADPKAMIAFKADKIRPGLYRVIPTVNTELSSTPSSPLRPDLPAWPAPRFSTDISDFHSHAGQSVTPILANQPPPLGKDGMYDAQP